MVWKQNDSYSTFVPLHERQEQHGTALLLFQSKRFQIPAGHFCKFLQRPLHLSMDRGLWLERRSW